MDNNDDYGRKLLSATRLCAFCAVMVLIIVVAVGLVLLPRVVSTIDNLQLAAANINAVDWKGLTADVSKAADNLSKIDLDKLTQIIENLEKAIAPVAELFGVQ